MRLPPAFLVPLLPLLLAGCLATAPMSPDSFAADALLVGEQHDADEHREATQQWVAGLASRGVLGALAVEMAERGNSTEGLPADASEAQVRQALGWDTQAWPWPRYGSIVMAAVRAGAPVFGANLPRAQQRRVMDNPVFDTLLSAPGLAAQQQAIRAGHCNLLPEHQIPALARIQIARDQSMAFVVAGAAAPGKTVVLLAGAGHVHPALGVPRHLPAKLSARSLVLPARDLGKDNCEELRKQMKRVPPITDQDATRSP